MSAEILEIRKPGLRETKAALQKLRILDVIQEELKTRPWNEITVEEISAKSMISKVTFFKYFPAKESIFGYMNAVLIYQIKTHTKRHQLKGIPALIYLFRRMGQILNENTRTYELCLNSALEDYHQFKVSELTLAEMLAVYPEETHPDPAYSPSMGQFILFHTQYALRKGEIQSSLSSKEVISLMSGIFQGSGLMGLRIKPRSPGMFYLVNLRALLKMLNYKPTKNKKS